VVTEFLETYIFDINVTDKHGNTPLHIACQRGHLGVVRRIIDKEGIRFDGMNIYGQTLLYLAR
jgi:ankyrin repeat protein